MSVLQHISQLKFFEFLQINHVNRIVNGQWNSKADIGGSLFEMSTSFELFCRNKLRYREDSEKKKRFYHTREINYNTKAHPFAYNVWKRSLSLRYLIEAAMFFIAMLIFQNEVSSFNQNLHLDIVKVAMYNSLEDEIVSRGGKHYQERSESGTLLEVKAPLEAKQMLKAMGEEMMFEARKTGARTFNMTMIGDPQLFILEDLLHEEMVTGFRISAEALDLVLYISLGLLLLPVAIFNKWLFSRMTHIHFTHTSAQALDMVIVILVIATWVVVADYESSDLKYRLFNKEEDSQLEIKFIGNIIQNIMDNTFHFDYLIASITAVLWLRCILLLRLTETFGPVVVMIGKMVVIIMRFLVIYLLGLLTFASVATLTLSESMNFRDLFNSLRQYLMASLGNFDIFQYDNLEGWKRYYAIFLHVMVLFSNMILLINLLIAIMSDEYASLSNVRTGLYWGSVIDQMPKYRYNKYYGGLQMVPFIYSFLGFFAIPCYVSVHNHKTLESISNMMFHIAYSTTVAMIALPIFMAVNLALLPFAYLKTVVHKYALWRHFKG